MRKYLLWGTMLLLGARSLAGGVKPQAGLESYFGPNRVRLLTPWLGLRIPVSPQASILLKYYHHNIRFDYVGNDDQTRERTAVLSNFTGALYAQMGRHEVYSALSLFSGTDSYSALAFDGGVGLKLADRLTLELGTYLVSEDSILWYPEDAGRRIHLYSAKAGLKYKLTRWLTLNPRLHIYRNSDDVDAATYALGILISPIDPVYLSVVYLHYTESALYKFAGDYLSVGLNFYY